MLTTRKLFFSTVQQPLVGQGLLITEASQWNSRHTAPVGLLFASDQPVAETFTLQQTTLLLNFRVLHAESSGQSFASFKLGAVCSKHNVPCLCYCHTADASRHMAGACVSGEGNTTWHRRNTGDKKIVDASCQLSPRDLQVNIWGSL